MMPRRGQENTTIKTQTPVVQILHYKKTYKIIRKMTR